MNEPTDLPDSGRPRHVLDRSQQAARFLDLTRQGALDPDDDDDDAALPLVTAHLRGVMAARNALDPDREASRNTDIVDDADDLGADDVDADALDAGDLDADDIRIDPSALGAFRPGAVRRGDGLGRFTLDDDGDVFGDGNGFAADAPFGHDPDDGPF